jgi:glycosidase
MPEPRYPALYQINARVLVTELGAALGRPASLDDVADEMLDRIGRLGFDWVWLLGVWCTGAAGRRVSRTHLPWREEFIRALPDLTDDDICGSCFAITGYSVNPALGDDDALGRFRERLRARGLKLMLDFVPNHVALDHPWVNEHPDWFVVGGEDDIAREPHNWTRQVTARQSRILAHGRDPYFPGWPDTLQLNYGDPDLQQAMQNELVRIARIADGVRCDMAMLILPEVFRRTWRIPMEPFWFDAIAAARRVNGDFRFMAEVYWDLEWALQQLGFDWTYDKRLYDRLRSRAAREVRDHLVAGLDFQDRLARFLENHDEPRAAATFPVGMHEAAATITYLAPGLRLFQDGQLEGRQVRLPMHLSRRPVEPVDPALSDFYQRLLELLREAELRNGAWSRVEPMAAWDGNRTWDSFVAGIWRGAGDGRRLVVVVNYSPADGQCHLRLPFPELARRRVWLRDLLGAAEYERDGASLLSPGLYLDMPGWGYHVFALDEMS